MFNTQHQTDSERIFFIVEKFLSNDWINEQRKKFIETFFPSIVYIDRDIWQFQFTIPRRKNWGEINFSPSRDSYWNEIALLTVIAIFDQSKYYFSLYRTFILLLLPLLAKWTNVFHNVFIRSYVIVIYVRSFIIFNKQRKRGFKHFIHWRFCQLWRWENATKLIERHILYTIRCRHTQWRYLVSGMTSE